MLTSTVGGYCLVSRHCSALMGTKCIDSNPGEGGTFKRCWVPFFQFSKFSHSQFKANIVDSYGFSIDGLCCEKVRGIEKYSRGLEIPPLKTDMFENPTFKINGFHKTNQT